MLLLLFAVACVPEGRSTIDPEDGPPAGQDGPDDGNEDPTSGGAPSGGTDDDGAPPVDSSDPNALRFGRDILPILETHCTECHDEGRAYDFTQLPLGPAGAGVTIELMLAAAGSVMPPPPREKMSSEEMEKLRTWKMQGLLP